MTEHLQHPVGFQCSIYLFDIAEKDSSQLIETYMMWDDSWEFQDLDEQEVRNLNADDGSLMNGGKHLIRFENFNRDMNRSRSNLLFN